MKFKFQKIGTFTDVVSLSFKK